MKRRQFLASLAGAASAPFGAAAQQRKLPRIGVLWPGTSADAEHLRLEALREGLKGVGLVHAERAQVTSPSKLASVTLSASISRPRRRSASRSRPRSSPAPTR